MYMIKENIENRSCVLEVSVGNAVTLSHETPKEVRPGIATIWTLVQKFFDLKAAVG